MIGHAVFTAVEASGVAVFMRENAIAFPLAEAVHVLGLSVVVGSIGMVDLRLLGVSARSHAVTRYAGEILPWTWGAFAVAATTGLLMFSSAATKYAANLPFLIKMGLLACAALNMLVFHLITQKSVAQWDNDTPTPLGAKVAGGLSLVLWIGVVAAGRWIGFV